MIIELKNNIYLNKKLDKIPIVFWAINKNKNLVCNKTCIKYLEKYEIFISINELIKDFKYNNDEFNNFLNNEFNTNYDINENIFVIDQLFPSDNKIPSYFHFIFHTLPKFSYYFKQSKINKLKIFMDIRYLPKWVMELFEILNLKKEDFIYTDRPFINSKKTFICKYINVDYLHKDSIDFYNNHIIKIIDKMSIKNNIEYLISIRNSNDEVQRRKTGMFKNRKDIINLTSKYKFIDLDTSKLPLIDNINMFMKLKIIIVENGAGITNLLWCSPETIVIVLQTFHRCKLIDKSMDIKGYPPYNNICKKFKHLYVISCGNINSEENVILNVNKLKLILEDIFTNVIKTKQQ